MRRQRCGSPIPPTSTEPTITPSPPATFAVQAALTSGALLDAVGDGNQQSAAFTAPRRWTIDYTYDCSGSGQAGASQLKVLDGSYDNQVADVTGMTVGKAKGQISAATFFLQIASACAWHVTATA
jgi:hypothetical protein